LRIIQGCSILTIGAATLATPELAMSRPAAEPVCYANQPQAGLPNGQTNDHFVACVTSYDAENHHYCPSFNENDDVICGARVHYSCGAGPDWEPDQFSIEDDCFYSKDPWECDLSFMWNQGCDGIVNED
jgi:hypothetical protein